jgi:hypothetical protein
MIKSNLGSPKNQSQCVRTTLACSATQSPVRLNPDQVNCAEAEFLIRVQSLERALRQTQPVVEDANDCVIDLQRLADERTQDTRHRSYRRSWVCLVHDLRRCQRIVLRDIEGLCGARITNSLR